MKIWRMKQDTIMRRLWLSRKPTSRRPRNCERERRSSEAFTNATFLAMIGKTEPRRSRTKPLAQNVVNVVIGTETRIIAASSSALKRNLGRSADPRPVRIGESQGARKR